MTTLPMVTPDGQLYDVPEEQAQEALDSGYRHAEPNELQTIHFKTDDGEIKSVPTIQATAALAKGWQPYTEAGYEHEQKVQEAQKGFWNSPVGIFGQSALDSATLGVSGTIINANRTQEGKEAYERSEEENPISHYAGAGIGILGSLLIPGGAIADVGEAAGRVGVSAVDHILGNVAADAAEKGGATAVKAALDAISPEAAEQAVKYTTAKATEEIGKQTLLHSVAGSVANNATQALLYSAPSALANAIVGDPNAAAENIVGSLGVGLALGVGGGVLGYAGNKVFSAGAEALSAGAKALSDAVGGKEGLQNLANEKDLQNLGINYADVNKLGLEHATKEAFDDYVSKTTAAGKDPKSFQDFQQQNGIRTILDVAEKNDLSDYRSVQRLKNESGQRISDHIDNADKIANGFEPEVQTRTEKYTEPEELSPEIQQQINDAKQHIQDFNDGKIYKEPEIQQQINDAKQHIQDFNDGKIQKPEETDIVRGAKSYLEDEPNGKRAEQARKIIDDWHKEIGWKDQLIEAKDDGSGLIDLDKEDQIQSKPQSVIDAEKLVDQYKDKEPKTPPFKKQDVIDTIMKDINEKHPGITTPLGKRFISDVNNTINTIKSYGGDSSAMSIQQSQEVKNLLRNSFSDSIDRIVNGDQFATNRDQVRKDLYDAFVAHQKNIIEGAKPQSVIDAEKLVDQYKEPKMLEKERTISSTPTNAELPFKKQDVVDTIMKDIDEKHPGIRTALGKELIPDVNNTINTIKGYGGDSSAMSMRQSQEVKGLLRNSFRDSIAKVSNKDPAATDRDILRKGLYDAFVAHQENTMDKVYSQAKDTKGLADYFDAKRDYHVAKILETYGNQLADKKSFATFFPKLQQALTGIIGSHTGVAGYMAHSVLGLPGIAAFPAIMGGKIAKNIALQQWARTGSNTLRKIANSSYFGNIMAKEAADNGAKKLLDFGSMLRNAPKRAIPDVSKLFLGDDANGLSKDQQFQKISDILAQVKANPQYVKDQMSALTSVFGSNPQLAQLVEEKKYAAIQYLYNNLPKAPMAQPFQSNANWKPTAKEKAQFFEKLDIVERPYSVLNYAANHTLTQTHINTLANVYPTIYKSIIEQTHNLAFDPKFTDLPVETKRQLGKLVNAPLDPGMRQLSAYQQSYAANPQMSEGQQQSNRGASTGRGHSHLGAKSTNRLIEGYGTKTGKLSL